MHRVASADCNPYLALTVMLAGGLVGLRDEVDPPPAFEGMAWGLPPGSVERLPGTIHSAADALRADDRLSEVLGADLVSYWLGSREWEWTFFHLGGGDPDSISEFELLRYFERV